MLILLRSLSYEKGHSEFVSEAYLSKQFLNKDQKLQDLQPGD